MVGRADCEQPDDHRRTSPVMTIARTNPVVRPSLRFVFHFLYTHFNHPILRTVRSAHRHNQKSLKPFSALPPRWARHGNVINFWPARRFGCYRRSFRQGANAGFGCMPREAWSLPHDSARRPCPHQILQFANGFPEYVSLRVEFCAAAALSSAPGIALRHLCPSGSRRCSLHDAATLLLRRRSDLDHLFIHLLNLR